MAARKADEWKKHLAELGLSRRRARVPAPASAPARAAEHVEAGRRGEREAARFLEERGVRILSRNVRYADGELDLVAEDAGVLLFVEVKLRRDAARGAAAEAVTPVKRLRVVRAARRWLAENPAGPRREVRFDVLAIQEEPFSMEWIRGAFDAS